jgi:hypothetical protein
MLKPFAEMMLPNAISQMEEDQRLDLEARLEANKDRSDMDNATMLIAFAKALGADASMFNMAESMGLEVDDELKSMLA